MSKWSKRWPEKAGYYWVYWRSNIDAKENGKLRLGMGQVRGPTGDGGYAYIVDGRFMYREEIDVAYWMPVEIPDLPKEVMT